ncbi:MAG TPA: MMPL family transporter [Thermoplasmata archaeon]|nr:MMPL family transporter [Thermoplasmata archaeon]
MSRASGEGYRFFQGIANLVSRRYKLLVVLWILVFVGALAANQVWPSGDVISYSQTSILPRDTESAQAQDIIDAQFSGQTSNSTATVVVVADNATREIYRWFVADLHAAIVASSTLGPGDSATIPLRAGGTFTVDRRIEFLRDSGNATAYAVYSSYAHTLAKQFNGPARSEVQYVGTAASIYWGLPAGFVSAWAQVPEPFSNATAYSAMRDAINATFPPSAWPWSVAYLDAFYPTWRGSFGDPTLGGAPPPVRAEVAISRLLPAFLDSPVGRAVVNDSAQRDLQAAMVGNFSLANFQDTNLIQRHALRFFPPMGYARLAFFEDLLRDLGPDPSDAEVRAFAEDESLRYDPVTSPLILPVDVAHFYFSADRTIALMNYAFDKEARYLDAEHREPIAEDVLVMRDLVSRLKAVYRLPVTVYVTGSAPASVDQELVFGGGAEFVATIVLAIVLIGLYFRSVVSPAFPILTIGIAIMIANLFVWFVAVYLFSVDFTVTAVLQTILLATGTDYSIFIVSRYRDERRDGRSRDEAVRNAVIWAGESVTTSGGAVLISFAALSLGSFPLMKAMGLTIGFAVTVALALALTFIPAVVRLVGNRVFWPSGHAVARPRPKHELTATERYFQGAARFSMRHAKAVLAVAILITIPATYLAVTDQPTFDFTQGSPHTESGDGIVAIADAFGEGLVYPTYVVVVFPDAVLLPEYNVSVPHMDALLSLSLELVAREPGVKSVEGPANPQGGSIDYWNLSAKPVAERKSLVVSAMGPYIGKDNRTARLVVVLANAAFSREAISTIDRLEADLAEIRANDPELRPAEIYVGGVSAVLNDVRDNTNRDLQVMALVVVTGLFLVLLFVLGSVLIPVRAILTILLSISWTMALTILLFHFWKGLDIIFLLPLALFVMAMGLGMDYDIFIITRVREEVAKGASDPDAITEATTRTGGIISACGIVMAGAFFTLMLSRSPFLQQIGFALAFAILLDSMVVRMYLVPAIMVLAGKYNWWAPGRLQRVRREAKKGTPAPADPAK